MIRSSLIALVIVVCLTVCTSAQDKPSGLTGLGIKAGVNWGRLGGDDITSIKRMTGLGPGSRMALSTGAFITYALGKRFALEPELLYSMKGAKWQWGNFSTRTKLSYLEVPVLVKLLIPTATPGFKPNILAGPALAFLLSAKQSTQNAPPPYYTTNGDLPLKDYMKSTDLSIILGAGAEFGRSERGNLTADIRYSFGLSSVVNKDPGLGYFQAPKLNVRTRGLSVLLGYSFR